MRLWLKERWGTRMWSIWENYCFWDFETGLANTSFPNCLRKKDIVQELIQHYNIIESWVGSIYYTDDWHAYVSLSLRGDHVVVSKEKGKPKGRNHINSIEGFWSYAKR